MEALRRLSLVNVRITAAPAFEQCTVDINAIASYMGRQASKLFPITMPLTMLALITVRLAVPCRPCDN